MKIYHLNRVAPLVLVLIAALFGSTLVVSKSLLVVMSAADVVFLRYAGASAVLLLTFGRHLRMSAHTASWGIGLGLIFAAGQWVSTQALGEIEASLSGFLIGLSIVITPLLSMALFRTRISARVWLAVGLATLGLAALSLTSATGGLGSAEWLTLASAALFAAHIVGISRVVTPRTALSLTLAQTLTIATITGLPALANGVDLPQTGSQWAGLVYLAVLCGAVPLAGQVWAQSHVDAAKTAVVMGTEPVWAALIAILVGGEQPSLRLALAALAIGAAIAVVVVPAGRWRGRVRSMRRRFTRRHTSDQSKPPVLVG